MRDGFNQPQLSDRKTLLIAVIVGFLCCYPRGKLTQNTLIVRGNIIQGTMLVLNALHTK